MLRLPVVSALRCSSKQSAPKLASESTDDGCCFVIKSESDEVAHFRQPSPDEENVSETKVHAFGHVQV